MCRNFQKKITEPLRLSVRVYAHMCVYFYSSPKRFLIISNESLPPISVNNTFC